MSEDLKAKAKAEAEAAVLDPDQEVSIVTTEIGALPVSGLVPVGTNRTIKVSDFSRAWMKPADKASAAVISAWLVDVDKKAAEAREREKARLDILSALKG